MLSPHIGVHVQVGVQGQDHPGRTPSPFAVHPLPSPAFPSSQTSEPTTLESPIIGVQTVGDAPLQFHPVSIVQVASHPSFGEVFESSHVSGEVTSPFPHCTVQVKAPGGVPVQVYPAAGPTHPTAHPTPSFDPSSQVSGVWV